MSASAHKSFYSPSHLGDMQSYKVGVRKELLIYEAIDQICLPNRAKVNDSVF